MKGIFGAAVLIAGAGAIAFAQATAPAGPGGQGRARGPALPPPIELAPGNAMNNPYRMLENWPHLGDIKPGAAIGIIPDGKGGVWLQHRSVPAILHIDSVRQHPQAVRRDFSSSHGFCQDRTEISGRRTAARSTTRPTPA